MVSLKFGLKTLMMVIITAGYLEATPLQDAKYDERCKQIALETLYVFSKVK